MSPEPTTVKRAKTEKVKILHIAGSPVSKYYSMISVHYARQMLASASDEKTRAAFDFTFAIVLPGGAWSIVRDLDEETIESAKKLSHGEAIVEIAAADYDAAVPHMFCWPGYTAYRFVFTAVRGNGRSIQLGEVRLYDVRAQRRPVRVLRAGPRGDAVGCGLELLRGR